MAVERVANALGADWPTGNGRQVGAEAPVLADAVGAAQLERMTVIVRQIAVAANLHPGIVEGLGTATVAEVEIGIDRTLGVALAVCQCVRGVERPFWSQARSSTSSSALYVRFGSGKPLIVPM